jgi:hypothetical protein
MKQTFRYKENAILEGYRVERVKCYKCNGTKYYSGVYGNHACEDCSNGYVFIRIKLYKKRKNSQKRITKGQN